MIRYSIAVLAAVLFVQANVASAAPTLQNDTINVAYSDTGAPGTNRSENVTVGSGVEVSCPSSSVFCSTQGQFPNILFAGEFIDIGDTSIKIGFNSELFFPAVTFVGFVFSDLDFSPAAEIDSIIASTSGVSGFASSDVTFTGDSISVNLADVDPSIGGFVLIDFKVREPGPSTPVPAPGSMALLLLGVGCLALRHRRTPNASAIRW